MSSRRYRRPSVLSHQENRPISARPCYHVVVVENEEIWRDIPGFPDYQASSVGRVRRASSSTCGKSGHMMKLSQRQPEKSAHLTVQVWFQGKSKTVTVSRLMALAFHGLPPTPQHEAAHNDGNPTRNVPSNVRWATGAENAADRRLHGTALFGETHPMAILTEDKVRLIRRQRAEGATLNALGLTHGVHLGTIWRLVNRKTWAHIE